MVQKVVEHRRRAPLLCSNDHEGRCLGYGYLCFAYVAGIQIVKLCRVFAWVKSARRFGIPSGPLCIRPNRLGCSAPERRNGVVRASRVVIDMIDQRRHFCRGIVQVAVGGIERCQNAVPLLLHSHCPLGVVRAGRCSAFLGAATLSCGGGGSVKPLIGVVIPEYTVRSQRSPKEKQRDETATKTYLDLPTFHRLQ